ncbi:MAG TPA: hypothetical protein VK530_18385 [Candidatus Acidoferrum sp.]|nr:hypothetical protein [Candidatus Acidoferrum sp.]
METRITAAPTNVIHKSVALKGDWQRKVEEHAMNGISFVVRPFRKDDHWPFLEELCERFNLSCRFVAFERSAYFDAPLRTTVENSGTTYPFTAQIVFR